MSVPTQTPTRTDVVTALRTALHCPVHGPQDPDWESVRRGWNLHVDQQPAAIVEPLTVTDVQEAVRVAAARSEEHTSELQSRGHLVCRLLLEKKKTMPSRCTGHQ